MRVAGFMMVRNEEDILEASIRHNLSCVDSLLIIDHGSDDATPAILAALVNEGLPIELQRDDSLGLPRPETSALCIDRLLERGADVCIPLDADEFLRVPSRAPFEQIVRDTDPAQSLALHVQTYVPAFDIPGDIVQRLRHARTASDVPAAPGKTLVRRTAGPRPNAGDPSESAGIRPEDRGARTAPAMVSAAAAMVARVPIRSPGQFAAKIAVGHLVRALGGDDTRNPFRWQDEYAALMAGEPFTPERLTAIAARYSLLIGHAPDPQQAAWIADPFLGDIRLVHTPALAPNALARILAFGERVASEIALRTGGL